jgi:hypothetical protein
MSIWSITRAKRLIPVRARPVAKALYLRALPRAWKQSRIAHSVRGQARLCRTLGSSLYAELLEHTARDVEEGGPCWTVLGAAEPTPVGADDALPLRFMAAVHRLVLEERAPALARHFPSAGGIVGEDPWPAFKEVVSEHIEELRHALRRPVQTNEVGRCAALIGGFLTAAGLAGGRLRVLELGASAGLNLRWDRYRYEAGDSGWGDPSSPVRFQGVFLESRPPFNINAEVVERAGCDVAPLDPTSPADCLTLASLVWPDQVERFERLHAALDIARGEPVRVDTGDAPEWLAVQLERKVEGVATVVFHSFFEQYLTDVGREQLRVILTRAGKRATELAPIAHLRMGWGSDGADIEMTTWPGGRKNLLATADNQGRSIRWLGG